ncbi:hypothetical protein AB4212_33660, partial [Streptomyces sp. 2MCAF27]
MKNHARKLVTAASGALLAIGLTTGSAVAADTKTEGKLGPTACYDVLTSYSKPSGQKYFPYNGQRLQTTSRCSDINIMPNASGYIAVCFHPSSGSEYCNGWTAATANKWNVVATGVRDGTQFY